MLEKLRKLRKDHLKVQYGITFYPYQEQISDEIIAALVQNLRLTIGATEKDIDKLKQLEIGIEISRQAGKTYAVGLTVEFIMTFLSELFNRAIRIGIFASQLDQAKISYNLIRDGSRKVKEMIVMSEEEERAVREEENARKLVMPNGSSAIIAPINKVSQIEGLALDLIIVDEAQLADDQIVQHSIWPMGKTTNAPRVYIGKAGTQICHFYRLGQSGESIKVYFKDIVEQRRKTFEQTDNALHLIYEKSVNEDINKYGADADFIQREYFGKWQIGTGQFVTQEALEGLIDDNRERRTFHEKDSDCYIGIDTAKHPDSTVVTVLRYNKDLGKKQVINWLELKGENYKDQFDIIQDFLGHYKVVAVAIDSTGQGDFMPDMFERESEWQDEHSGLYRVKFSAVSKDMIYKNLKVSISELLTDLPKLATRETDKFKQQMLDLQQEYKGQLLSVKHPDDQNAHDDYPDSWALAEWAYAKYNEDNNAQVIFVGVEKERKVEKDAEGKVRDYWPGEESWA